MNALLARLWPQDTAQRVFVAFVLLLLAGGATALLADSPLGFAPALAAVGVGVLVVDWRWVYYLLLTTLAFSREFPLPGGLSLDVPSEPLMLVVLGCLLVSLLTGRTALTRRELTHPLVLVLGLMLLWAVVSTLFSVDTGKSVKYLLAKSWYIGPFLFVTLLLLRRPADVWKIAACHALGASCTVFYTAVRHAGKGFSFDSINHALTPFYINHVIYATVLALLLPYAWYAAKSSHGAARMAWRAAMVVMLFGLFTSYTRASILSLPVAGLFYLVMRLRLTRWVLIGAVAGMVGGALYFVQENNFMLYAPNFEKTIFNGNNFEKHLEATYKLEDVSGMERVYRWVAAVRMLADKPLTGSGPATFYPEYKRYTVKSFRTYVSDNPEHSTTHNYFLLQLAEQGFPGFALFVLLLSVTLLFAETLYHRTAARPELRRVTLAASLSLVVIIFHLLLNELIEVDKIGSFFFIGLAVLIRIEGWLGDESAAAAS
ncbi:O-antigen ligase family protein [Hymenobacter busanensis]|uniref:O-antigen ligase family protein n=1 Tax=Hymenobacter busanensis TaxID=2607656 RepID=A0A7L4ZUM3_9BACT|nr:O-antigen ligase family protein [Hymenobacter busanensis]KAA9339348.1 O-antigen ligase family protein [Hymenobacter busanensis]QHJ06891.1 O-antigen ligase family protein [Hymenobacter busanensis]